MSSRRQPLRTGELARMAGLSPSQVWHCIQRGHLKAFQWDRRGWHYVWPEDAAAWLEARAQRRAELEARRATP